MGDDHGGARSNPYAAPGVAAAAELEHSSRLAGSGLRAFWLRAVVGTLVLRVFVTSIALFIMLGLLVEQRVSHHDMALGRLIDILLVVFVAAAMWRLTDSGAGTVGPAGNRYLRLIARWLAIAWALIAVLDRIANAAWRSTPLTDVRYGMYPMMLAGILCYAGSLAPQKWLKGIAFTIALATAITVPWRWTQTIEIVLFFGAIAATAVVGLLVARALDRQDRAQRP
jgi:hypothetical protein